MKILTGLCCCHWRAGSDHDAFIWNPFVDRCTFRLQGHNHSLVKAICVPNSPQIITADVERTIKIWDCRNFHCMQTLQLDEAGFQEMPGEVKLGVTSVTFM
eukprot:1182075-Prorocentrum_minimum.AAC.3